MVGDRVGRAEVQRIRVEVRLTEGHRKVIGERGSGVPTSEAIFREGADALAAFVRLLALPEEPALLFRSSWPPEPRRPRGLDRSRRQR